MYRSLLTNLLLFVTDKFYQVSFTVQRSLLMSFSPKLYRSLLTNFSERSFDRLMCSTNLREARHTCINLLLFCNVDLHSSQVVLNSSCEGVIGSGQFRSSTAVQDEWERRIVPQYKQGFCICGVFAVPAFAGFRSCAFISQIPVPFFHPSALCPRPRGLRLKQTRQTSAVLSLDPSLLVTWD